MGLGNLGLWISGIVQVQGLGFGEKGLDSNWPWSPKQKKQSS